MRSSVQFLARSSFVVFFLASAALACALRGHELVPSSPVTFKAAGDELTPEGAEALTHVAEFLSEKKEITLLRIEGRVEQGTPDAQAVSEKRAATVARWLIAHGVDCKRLLPVGFGANKPISGEDTQEGRASNRRITFMVAMLAGRPVGGLTVDGGGRIVGDPCAK